MTSKLTEIKLRSINYADEQAKADTTVLLNIVTHLLAETTIQYFSTYRPLVCPGIELECRNNKWRGILNVGNWIGSSNEDFDGVIKTTWMTLEQAVKTAQELAGQFGLILTKEDNKILLFYDKSVTDELEEHVERIAIKLGFRTE